MSFILFLSAFIFIFIGIYNFHNSSFEKAKEKIKNHPKFEDLQIYWNEDQINNLITVSFILARIIAFLFVSLGSFLLLVALGLY